MVKGIGNYPHPSDIGLPNDSISSVKVGSNVETLLCRNDDFDGCVLLTSDDPDLSDNGIDNQVSSVIVQSRQNAGVQLCRRTDYIDCMRITSDIPSLGNAGFGNDDAESIRIDYWSAVLYEDDNYGGLHESFDGSDPDLINNDFIQRNQASSIRVRQREPWIVTLYEHNNYQGFPFASDRRIHDLNDWNYNDTASSIKVQSGYCVRLYEHANFTGNSMEVSADRGDLSGLDNQVSSFEIFNGNCPTPTPTHTPSITPTPTITPTPSSTPTATPTVTPMSEVIAWTMPVSMSTALNGAIYGSIMSAFDRTDQAHMVWRDRGEPSNDNDSEWTYTTLTITGTPSARMNPCPSPGQSNSVKTQSPRIAVEGDGTVHVVWMEGWWPAEIYHAVKSPGNDWQCWDNVSQSSTQSTSPVIAVDSQGTIHVAYSEHIDNHQPEVWYRYKPRGGGWSGACQISNSLDEVSEAWFLLVDQQDNVHLIWADGGGGSRMRYRWKPRDSGCSWSSDEAIGPPSGSAGYAQGAAVDDQGTVHWAWYSSDEIWYQYRPRDESWASPENISNTPGIPSGIRDLEVDSAGTVYVFFDDGGANYYKAKPRGGRWTEPVPIPLDWGDMLNGIAIDHNDRFLMAWTYSWGNVYYSFGQRSPDTPMPTATFLLDDLKARAAAVSGTVAGAVVAVLTVLGLSAISWWRRR